MAAPVQPQLDHVTVQAADRKASGRLRAEILGFPWADESGIRPFAVVPVNDGLALDFDQAERAPRGAEAPEASSRGARR